MTENSQRRNDPIHRVFKKLRDGFAEVVVNIAERVEQQIQLFIDDERHQQPTFERVVQEGLMDVVSVFTGWYAAGENEVIRGDSGRSEETPPTDVESNES